jgi:hypothetical protein
MRGPLGCCRSSITVGGDLLSIRPIRILAGLLIFSGLGCGSDPNGANAGCSDRVVVSVATGLQPLFIWSPNCAVHNLVVLEGVGPHSFGQGTATWVVESQLDVNDLPNNRLHSTIRYGEVPPEGREVTAPVALSIGQPYTVYLNVYTVDQRVETVGSKTFTP